MKSPDYIAWKAARALLYSIHTKDDLVNVQNFRINNPENNSKDNRENKREERPHPKEANPEVSVGRVHTATAKPWDSGRILYVNK